MSNDLIPRDVSQELKVNLLKQLDSVLCNDNNVICWGAENAIGLTIVEKEVSNSIVEDTISTSLTVKFYVNNLGQVILTTIK
jgi:hypothetical protein